MRKLNADFIDHGWVEAQCCQFFFFHAAFTNLIGMYTFSSVIRFPPFE